MRSCERIGTFRGVRLELSYYRMILPARGEVLVVRTALVSVEAFEGSLPRRGIIEYANANSGPVERPVYPVGPCLNAPVAKGRSRQVTSLTRQHILTERKLARILNLQS